MKSRSSIVIMLLVWCFLLTSFSYACLEPVAILDVEPEYVAVGGQVELDGSASYATYLPPGHDVGINGLGIIHFEWDYNNDGVRDAWEDADHYEGIPDGIITKQFDASGIYNIRLRVKYLAEGYGTYWSDWDDCSVDVYVGDIIYVNDAATGDNTGGSWANAFNHLQDALDVAQPGHQIWVAAGTYYPDKDKDGDHQDNVRSETFGLVDGVELYGGFAGGETSLAERNLKDNKTILSGDIDGNDIGWLPGQQNCYHVVTGANNSLIDGFFIIGGVSDGTDNLGGGGMLNNNVSGMVINNCYFSCNNAGDTHHGGGLYNKDSSVVLTNCLFSNNTAAKWDITNNEIDYGNGGAIYNDNSTTSLTNCTLSDNLAGEGGGVYMSSGLLTVDNCILWANENALYVENGVDNDGDGRIDLDQIRIVPGSTVDVTYSCIQDDDPCQPDFPFGGADNNNIDVPPKFVTPGNWQGVILPGSISIDATVRDFDGFKTQDDQPKNPPGHIDFQNKNEGLEEGIVANTLTDGLPTFIDSPKGSVADANSFYSWYRDVEGINKSTTKTLVLFPTDVPGEYKFSDKMFYPIDNELLDEETGSIEYHDNGSPYENTKDDDFPWQYHNYHFTLHLSSEFYYDANTEPYLKMFKADDDMWIFIDGQLVIDLGGVHAPKDKYMKIVQGDIEVYSDANFNTLVDTIELGLDSNTYSFDLFFAERHTKWSHLEFSTTLEFIPEFTQGDYHLQAGSPCIDAGNNTVMPAGIGTDLDGLLRFIDDPNTLPDGADYVDMGAYEYQILVANAGQNQQLDICFYDDEIEVTLDGSNSYEGGREIISYEWTWTEDSELKTDWGVNPTVIMTASETPYTVTLTITDSLNDTDTDTVEISFSASDGPTADINVPGNITDGGVGDEDGNVDAGADVVLDGSGSGGVGLTYIWYAGGNEIAQGPNPTIRLGLDVYTIGLLVIDDCGRSDYETIIVTVDWPDPDSAVVDAGPIQEFDLPLVENIYLHGSEEYDPGNIITQYEWELLSAPPGGYVTWPSDQNELEPQIVLPEGIIGTYKFMLHGRNSSGIDEDTDTTSITVKSTPSSNLAPEVEAWIDVDDVNESEHTITLPTNTVKLEGIITDDGQPSGELTGTWRQISGPIGGVTFTPMSSSCSDDCRSLILEDPDWCTASFKQEGKYLIALEADDGSLSKSDVVVVYVDSGMVPDIEAGDNDFGILDAGQADVPMSDAYVTDRCLPFDDTTKTWTLIVAESTSTDINFVNPITGQVDDDANHLEKPTIRFYEDGKYKFELTATDAQAGDGVPDIVWVTIQEAAPEPPQYGTCTALYAGVSNLDGTGDVYRRSPDASPSSPWVCVSTSGDFNGPVLSLCEYGGDIYAGTKFGADSWPRVKKLSANMTWEDVSTDEWDWFWVNRISSLAVYNNELYAGVFDNAVFRYDGIGSTTWTRTADDSNGVFVPSWCPEGGASETGVACMFPWGEYLYLGHPAEDIIDRYDGKTSENVLNYIEGQPVVTSCIWDFETYKDKIYACAHYCRLYVSDDGNEWTSHYQCLCVGGTCGPEQPACWSMEVFQNLLYINKGSELWTYIGNGDSFTQVTKNGQDWAGAQGGEILSLLAANENLFIGSGYPERGFNNVSGNEGRVYKLWIDEQNETHIDNFSEGQGIDPNIVSGVQCLISATVPCEPELLTMTVTAYAEDANDWVTAGDNCVSPEDFDADEIKYEITITPNDEPYTQGLVLTVILPDYVDFVEADDCGAYFEESSRGVIWLLDDIAPDAAPVTRTFIVKVNNKSLPDQSITTVFGLKNGYYQLIANDSTPTVCCWGEGILYVDQSNTTGLRNGRSWETALDSLSNALDHVAESNCYSEIWVAPGLYTLPNSDPNESFVIPDGISVYGSLQSDEESRERTNFRDSNNHTVISGWYLADYVVTLQGAATIEGLRIQNGLKAGIKCEGASASITRCLIGTNGQDAPEDAGIYLNGSTDTEITNCIIGDNDGVGIYLGSGSSAFIRNNTIVNNSGYGVENAGSPLTLYNCILWSNGSGPESGCDVNHCYTYGADPFDPLCDFYFLRFDAEDCIDQGIDKVEYVYSISEHETDVEGQARTVGDSVDIGADEFPPIRVDAGETIFEEIPIGASSVQIDFTSASVLSNGVADINGNFAYQWYCIGCPGGGSCPEFVPGTDYELYASATFEDVGWYKFILWVMDVENDNVVVGADLLYVCIDMGVEIVVVGEEPAKEVSGVRTYETYVDEVLNLDAVFGPPPGPNHVEWWAPYEPVTIGNKTDVDTTISFDTPGYYPIKLYAFDPNNELIGKDLIWINVGYPQVQVSAGADRTLYLDKSTGSWQVEDEFRGVVTSTTATRVEWSVEAADEDADANKVTLTPNTIDPSIIEATFEQYGVYFMLFKAWKDTSQGEVFLGTGVATVIVTYPQILVEAGTYDPIETESAPAILNLHGSVTEGAVDSFEWVFCDPCAPEGLVTFASPKSPDTLVSFNAVDGYSGGGTYTLILYGKININGQDIVVARDSVNINVTITGSDPNDSFKRVIVIETLCYAPEGEIDLPYTFSIDANITDETGTTSIPFTDYDHAIWTWSGTDGSLQIEQPDTFDPCANITIYQAGEYREYTLNLTVEKDGTPIGVASLTFDVNEISCIITAVGGFDDAWTEKVRDNIEIGSTVGLYGMVINSCPGDMTLTGYWYYSGDAGDVIITPKAGSPPNEVWAEATFTRPGTFPITFRTWDIETGKLAYETIIARVLEPGFWLDISGTQIKQSTSLPIEINDLTATILGGAPAGSTCTWSTGGQTGVSPGTIIADSGDPVAFTFSEIGTYNLTVTGNVADPCWSQEVSIPVYITEDLTQSSAVYNAGGTEFVTLPDPVCMSDALFISNDATIIPKWSVTGPSAGEVVFLPDEWDKNPCISFPSKGKYVLSLVPWDTQTNQPVNGAPPSTVNVFVDTPVMSGDDGPVVTLEVESQVGNLFELKAEATDDDGVAQLQLMLDLDVLKTVSGAPIYPSGEEKLILEYTLDVSHLSRGDHQLKAYARDVVGNQGQSSQIIISNTSEIAYFDVEPKTISDVTGPEAVFTASLRDQEITWMLGVVNKATGDSMGTKTGQGDLTAVDPNGDNTFDTTGWSDGSYKGILTTDGNNTGEVDFKIWRNSISKNDIVSELIRFSNESGNEPMDLNTELIPDDFEESLITQNGYPIPIVKNATRNIWCRVGHTDFPDDVKYSLQVCVLEDNELILVKIVTPEAHDSMGWAEHSSTGASEEEDLGEIDFSTLENGSYYLVLSVWCNGKHKEDYAQFILDCPLKIGNVKFSQEDLVIETGGISLSVVRTYDSFKKQEDGEFGYGWTYSIADMDLELDESRTTMHETDDFGVSDLGDERSVRSGGNLTNRNVTITLPDGRRTTFFHYLEPIGVGYYGQYWTSNYASMPGIDAELNCRTDRGDWDPDRREVCYLHPVTKELVWESVGHVGDDFTLTDAAQYDFYSYDLTTSDGTTYYFKRDTITDWPADYYVYGDERDQFAKAYYTIVRGPLYLTKIVTIDGEEILLNTDLHSGKIGAEGNLGIQHKDAQGTVGKSLEIIYYESEPWEGLIKDINAPSEVGGQYPTLQYKYDDQRNLIEVWKLVNENGASDEERYEILKYSYDNKMYDPEDHYVTEIKDERGLSPIRYFYDASGRLIETVDAKGNSIVIKHGAIASNGDKAEVVYERWDTEKLYPAVYAYNDRGNVTLIQKNEVGNPNPLEETQYYYEDPSYPDAPSRIVQMVPDPNDLMNPVPAETKYEYDKYGKTKLTVDPLGNATIITEYDSIGNLLEMIQAENYVDANNYDTVSVSHNTYEGSKLKTTEIRDANDTLILNMMVNIYDDRNRIVNAVNINVDEISNLSALFYLQDVNSLENKSEHAITTYSYNGTDLQPCSIEDPAGAVTFFEYDGDGRQKYSYYVWTDPEGIEDDLYVFTKNTYDTQGRVTKTERIVDTDADPTGVEPEAILSTTKYNSIGKVDYSISNSNNLTRYFYDQLGNVVETCTYNIAGIDRDSEAQINSHINNPDNILTTTRTLYDTEGAALITVGSYEPGVYDQDISKWPVGIETVYDVLGRAVETRRWAGVRIYLTPYKVVYGQAVPCDLDDDDMAGKMNPPGVYPEHAWDGTGTEPENIGWTSDANLPVAKANPAAGEIGPLSYTRTIYDIAGRVSHSVSLDENGYEHFTSYVYDIAGKQIEVIDPNGHDVDDLYAGGIVLNDGDGGTITAQQISGFGEGTDYNGTHKTVTHYDGTRRDYVTDARGNTTEFTYDSLGRVITTEYPPTVVYEGGPTAVPTYNHVQYDGLGRKVWQSETTTNAAPESVPDAQKRSFEYDVAGRLIATLLPDPDGGPTAVRYDYFYDDNGNMVGILDAENRLTVFEYDELGRQTAKYMPFVAADANNINNAADVYDKLAGAWPQPKFETSEYDDFGRVVKTTDYKEQVTGFEYDSQGRLEYKKYYANYGLYDANEPNETVWYAYDSLGRTEQVIETDNPLTYTRTTTYTYDADGRIVAIDTPQGAIGYGYDSITGQKGTTVSAINGIDYFYDKLGRLSTVKVFERNGQTVDEQSSYTYNEIGSRQSLQYANGNYAYYDYDALNRLTFLTNFEQFEADPCNPTGNTLSKFEYELYAGGMRKKITESVDESRTVEYTYDNLNRIKQEHGYKGSDEYTVGYTYDLAGNRTQRIVVVDNNTVGHQELTTTYTYDPNTDRLLIEEHDGPELAAFIWGEKQVYTQAEAGRFSKYHVAGENRDIGSFEAWLFGMPNKLSQYLFRAVSLLFIAAFFAPALIHRRDNRHRLSFFHRGMCILLAFVMFVGPEGFYQLANADIAYSELATTDWANGNRTITYTYDDNGSVVQKVTKETDTEDLVETVNYTYNLQNRLARVETIDHVATTTTVVAYKYNPDGIRVAKIDDPDGAAVVTTYLIDSENHTGYAQVFTETKDTDVTTYIIGDDVLAQATNSADPQYLLYDGHGSTRQLSDSAGTLVPNESYSYDAYGVMLGGERTTETNLLYTGEHFDTDAQMYYLRARYYNPSNGLFNQVDPYSGNNEEPQSLHKYLYCHSNPVNNHDLSGLSIIDEPGGYPFNWRTGTMVHAIFYVLASLRGGFWNTPVGNIVRKDLIGAGLSLLRPDAVIEKGSRKGFYELKPISNRDKQTLANRVKLQMKFYDFAFERSGIGRGNSKRFLGVMDGAPVGFVRYNGSWWLVKFFSSSENTPVIGNGEGLVYYSLDKIDYEPPKGGEKLLRPIAVPEWVKENVRIPQLAPITITQVQYISQQAINTTYLALASSIAMGIMIQSVKPGFARLL